MKVQIIDGKYYRMRRGKLVQIPDEWVGRQTTSKTIRQRPSKKIHKLRKNLKHPWNIKYRKIKENERTSS